MKFRGFSLVADHNIQAVVVEHLQGEGFQVTTVAAIGMAGARDVEILAWAVAANAVVVTHDADFGSLAIAQGLPFVGIVYLRPGHVQPQPSIESLRHLMATDPDLTPPFLAVLKRAGDKVTLRVRRGDSTE